MFLLALACTKAEPTPSVETPVVEAAALDLEDPETCRACHAPIVEEYGESMHARSHHSEDPLYAAMRALRMDKQGEQVANKCANCHHPRELEELDSAKAQHGVSCASCHNVAEVRETGVSPKGGPHGAKALVWGEPGSFYGPNPVEAGVSPAHGTGGPVEHLSSGEICLACHGETKTPALQPACTTGPEIAANTENTKNCVDCHMPEVEGGSGAFSQAGEHRSHAFLGPHRAWYQGDPGFLASAVELELGFTDAGAELRLDNLSAHAFPTGFPGRVAVLVVAGHDASGESVWSEEHKLMKVYVDETGQPTLPPFAAELASDSRLQGGESRSFELAVPAEVERLEAKLMLRLIAPKGAEVLGLSEAPEGQPQLVKAASARR